MNTETKKLVKQAMELRRKGMSKMLRELYDEGETNVLYVAANVLWDDMGRWEIDGEKSVCGPEMADLSSYFYTDGTFHKIGSGGNEDVADVKLLQAMRAYQVASSQKEQILAVSRLGLSTIYVVNCANPDDRGSPLKIFDARGVGDVLTVKHCSKWCINTVPLTDLAAVKCDAAIVSGKIECFDHEGRNAYAVPNKSGTVTMLNYLLEEDSSKAVRASVPVFFDAYGDRAVGVPPVITPGILNYAMSLPKLKVFHNAMDSVPCVVVGSGFDFEVLNAGGKGVHQKFTYTPGFELPLPIIRSPLLNERLSKVSMRHVNAVCNGKMRNLFEMAKEAGTAAFAKPFGMEEGVDLSAETDTDVLNGIRFQATLVPGGKDTEVFEKIFSYQTHQPMSPTALYAHCTSFGTSFTTPGAGAIKLQPCTVDKETGEISAFNLSIKADHEKDVGDDATYTAAQNQKLLADGRGMAVPLGPVGFDKVPNASMLVQWPVSTYGYPATEPSSQLFDEKEEVPCYRSLAMGDGKQEVRSLAMGELKVATCGFGSYQGNGRGILNGFLKRRCDVKPTITYNRFYSIESPEDERVKKLLPGMYTVTKEHVRKVVQMLDRCYEIAGNSHNLFDKDEGTAIKVTKTQFDAGQISEYAMKEVSAPSYDNTNVLQKSADDDEPQKKPRYDLHEVAVPKMMMVEM